MENMNHKKQDNTVYRKLFFTLIISFIIMYLVMFLNVDEIAHVYISLTRTYMTLLMVSPMAVLMILMMGNMYHNKKLNSIIIGSGISVFIVAFIFLRNQTFVSDIQYMKAMIPHHSSAIMTSKHAEIKDPEVKILSENIIKSQEEEIKKMKEKIKELQ
ncbi:DUF305 domain-containing protein [uncultured Chryseobacterium sp.]|uniref:DUF305 domain-containing protein n=1 Tax=uncultured Chryseobacterium sp. TaxID=259322 RepID=UPI0037494C67